MKINAMDTKIEVIGNFQNMQNQIIEDGHEVILLPNAKRIGVVNLEKSAENLSIIIERAKSAFNHNHFIEFVSLKIQYLEYYLKIYWVSKNPKNKILDEKNKIFFGVLISECRSFGFDNELIDKIDDFNKQRVLAIHKFLMGGTTESELGLVCKKYAKLGDEIFNYVLEQCGEIVTDLNKIPNYEGSMFISRPKRKK
jgi:hypothetical protein